MQITLKQNKLGIILMLISSCFVCTGQLFWKLSDEKGFLYLAIGFALYGIGALIMILAYRFGDLSVLQPMLSINYILTLILAVGVLHESLTALKLGGIFLVIIGVLLIGGGNSK